MGTLLTSAVLSAITIVVSCLIILAVLYIQLPSAALMGVSNGLGACMAQVGYAGILAIVGGWTGFAVAVITESRFLSMVLPVMLFEVWKELCIGSVSYKVAQFAVPYLFDPITNGMRVEAYVLFIILILIILGGGFYLIAAKKFEKGR